MIAVVMTHHIRYRLEDNTNDVSQEDNDHAWDTVPELLCLWSRIPEYSHDNVFCVHDAVECDIPKPGSGLSVIEKYTEHVGGYYSQGAK